MDRKELALELQKKGFNCAQAVAVAFSNVMGVDPITVYKTAEPLGFGMGDMEGQCGALTAALMVVGMKKSDGDMDDPKTKKQCYLTAQAMKAEFNDRVGATICKDIKGQTDGKVKLSCSGCVALSCELCDKYLLGIYPLGEEPEIKVIKNEHAKF